MSPNTVRDVSSLNKPLPTTDGAVAVEFGNDLVGEPPQAVARATQHAQDDVLGAGFIQRDDGQPDAFVHISAVERGGMTSLNEGDRLEFELEVDRRGKYAAVNLTSIA